MQAKHVMVSPVKTGDSEMSVRDVALILTENRISALPIVDQANKVIGIVSEGDLIRRAEIGTEKHRSWWLSLFTSNWQLAQEYSKSHAGKVKDVMTTDVICVAPDTPLSEVARLFERHGIKRVPVLDHGRLAGIVTRGNLVQAIATAPLKEQHPQGDEQIREKIQKGLAAEAWANPLLVNITVHGGVVDMWGIVRTDAERNAVRVAIENIAGVKAVNDNLALEPVPGWM
ncbi:MAG TPA: CBS domain-containing protein [Xanthobacteraceae bacterium]|nr:CBS domain-containing protein [Xanthobacteraceae bacterium]